jgi:ribosome assembly protein 1
MSDPTVMSTVEGNALTGFQMATLRGPLCDEPLFGVNVRLEVIPKPRHGDEEGDGGFGEEQYGPFSGQVTSATREAIRRSVLKAGPRLVEAMYLAVITTTSEALGGTYSVLGRRRAKILSESIREGTGVFIIHSYLPVAASFGFADELRHSSSGASNAQLMLSHWERLDIDPFFTPKTEEEREEFGEDGDAGPNMARQLVDATRRRKGLKVEETLIKVATKQRTLSRKA